MTRLGVDGRELVADARTGIGRYVLEVLRAASSRGWTCVVYGDSRTRRDLDLAGVTVRVLVSPSTQWWDQVSLPRALARDRISVFLSPYYKGPLLAPCPFVLTMHDLFFIGYPGRSRPLYDAAAIRLARLYARRARAIIADSTYSKRCIEERLRVDPAKVTVIPVALGAEFTPTALTDAVRRRYGIDGPYVLYLGNFRPHKNVPRLLGAYAALPVGLRADSRLVLAGGDRAGRSALEGLAARLGVADRVVFAGRIADADLAALYSGATLFVLPSLEEGFGLPALEAMACGTPVLAADRAALPELTAGAATLVDPEDAAAMTTAMARLLSTAELRADLRRRGLRRAGEFGEERTAGRALALLRAVADGGGPR